MMYFLRFTGEFYSIDLVTFVVNTLESMKNPRENPGFVCVFDVCYLFGGKHSGNGKIVTFSEKYSLKTGKWTKNRDLPSPKFAFNPCYYHEFDIYLVDVRDSGHSFDIFNIKTENYRSIPFEIECNMNGSVSFIVKNELFLVTFNANLVIWDLKNREKQPINMKISLKDGNSGYSGCTPVRYKEKMYWSNYFTGTKVTFDLVTHEVWEEGIRNSRIH